MQVDRNWGGRLLAAGLLVLVSSLAMAESLRIHKALDQVRFLFEATQLLSIDLGRPPKTAEWPSILLDAPPTEGAWRGPYLGGMPRDPWNNHYLFRADVSGPGTFGIYSIGVNGIDEGGSGDDVSSWQGADSSFYPHHYLWSDRLVLALPWLFAALLLVFGISVFRARCRRARGEAA